MARPTKFDRLNHEKIRAAAAACSSNADIAASLKVDEKTLRKAIENDPEIQEIIDAARAETGIAVANRLIESAKEGQVECMKFLLERKFRWLKETKVEHAGDAVPSICIKLTTADGTTTTA